MSANTDEHESQLPTTGADARDFDRYETVRTDGGELIVYDADVEEAWIQSSLSVALEDFQ